MSLGAEVVVLSSEILYLGTMRLARIPGIEKPGITTLAFQFLLKRDRGRRKVENDHTQGGRTN